MKIYQCGIGQLTKVVRTEEKPGVSHNNLSLPFAFLITGLAQVNFHFKNPLGRFWSHMRLMGNISDSQIKRGLIVFKQIFLGHRKNPKLLKKREFRVKHRNLVSFFIYTLKEMEKSLKDSISQSNKQGNIETAGAR